MRIQNAGFCEARKSEVRFFDSYVNCFPNRKSHLTERQRKSERFQRAHLGGDMFTGFRNTFSWCTLLKILAKITVESCFECTFCKLPSCGLACRSSKPILFVGSFRKRSSFVTTGQLVGILKHSQCALDLFVNCRMEPNNNQMFFLAAAMSVGWLATRVSQNYDHRFQREVFSETLDQFRLRLDEHVSDSRQVAGHDLAGGGPRCVAQWRVSTDTLG